MTHFLNMGFKHGKKWVDLNGAKCNMGFGRVTKNTRNLLSLVYENAVGSRRAASKRMGLTLSSRTWVTYNGVKEFGSAGGSFGKRCLFSVSNLSH